MDFRDHARRPRRIVVPGPLGPFADGVRQDLASQGYALDTVTDHVHLLADLSGWLGGRGLAAADLTGEAAGEFLLARRAAGRRSGVTGEALAPVLGYLRSVQAIPAEGQPVPATPLEALLAVYRQYLEGERGLSAGTIRHYLRYARVFLAGFPGPLTQTLQELSAGQVTGYVLEQARRRRQGAPDMVRLPALRSLLRYLHAAGHIPLPLDKAVPAGRAWRPGLPRAVPADHLSAALASCDRDSAGGRRDYAIVLAMTRLALRGGEVAGLRLADVGWRSGELTIHGKGGREDILPLPADVGEAMADYLLHARPATTAPQLFVTVKAPFAGLAVSSVTQVVARACGALALALPKGAWQRLSCGNGAKGRRWYDWALVATSRPEISLLIRRSTARPSELAFYLCHTPRPAPLAVLVKVAGARWAVEECFQAGKNEAGLDHYQVRHHKAWYRYVTLAMLALAWLAVTRAALADESDGAMSSANEIRRMFTALCGPPRDERRARHWSRWRHRHQERARHCHYQRRRQQDH